MSYIISKLQVDNFRNLHPGIIDFGPRINCILGDNGNGKTNILEAVYVLFTRKSFRKNTGFAQFLGIEGEKTDIIFSSVLNKGCDDQTISYSGRLSDNSSEWFLNGKTCRKKLDAPIIFINPFDSYSFHQVAAFRRSWFDRHISMIDKNYKTALSKHNNMLRFRNELLSKKPAKYDEQFRAMDSELARYAIEITCGRKKFLEELAPHCASIFRSIFSQEHTLWVELDSRVEDMDSEKFINAMRNRWQQDSAAGYTTYSVHKDDYMPFFDGLNALIYASLGQQKMSYLSLLFAYIELFRYKFNTFPVVLIDDVSGELDRLRWERLIEYLGESKSQVLITTANENFKNELGKISFSSRLFVRSGKVECYLH